MKMDEWKKKKGFYFMNIRGEKKYICKENEQSRNKVLITQKQFAVTS